MGVRVGLRLCGGLLIALACAHPRAAELQVELRDKLSAATVFIETRMALSSADWLALSKETRREIGRRPAGPVSGSGFLISQDGYVMTNAHVVSEFKENVPAGPGKTVQWRFMPTSVKVVLNSGREDERVYWPRIVKVDKGLDLALLKIAPQPDVEPLKINPTDEAETGQLVFMAGFPGGKLTDLAPFVGSAQEAYDNPKNPDVSLNAGMVTAVRKYHGSIRYQLDIRANHGNSGGPIVNPACEVVAVLYAGMDHMQSINYAIPSFYLGKVLPASITKDWPASHRDASAEQDYDDFKGSGTFKLAKGDGRIRLEGLWKTTAVKGE